MQKAIVPNIEESISSEQEFMPAIVGGSLRLPLATVESTSKISRNVYGVGEGGGCRQRERIGDIIFIVIVIFTSRREDQIHPPLSSVVGGSHLNGSAGWSLICIICISSLIPFGHMRVPVCVLLVLSWTWSLSLFNQYFYDVYLIKSSAGAKARA